MRITNYCYCIDLILKSLAKELIKNYSFRCNKYGALESLLFRWSNETHVSSKKLRVRTRFTICLLPIHLK